jgi:hypothetical protein
MEAALTGRCRMMRCLSVLDCLKVEQTVQTLPTRQTGHVMYLLPYEWGIHSVHLTIVVHSVHLKDLHITRNNYHKYLSLVSSRALFCARLEHATSQRCLIKTHQTPSKPPEYSLYLQALDTTLQLLQMPAAL